MNEIATSFVERGIKMTRKLFVLSGLILIIIVSIKLLSGKIDTLVFHPDELSSEKRFKSIPVGTPETELIRFLGDPDRIIISNPKTQELFYLDKGTKQFQPIKVDPSTGKPYYNSVAGFDVFPERPIAHKVLIYISGTVAAYYYTDQNDRVDYISVWIS